MLKIKNLLDNLIPFVFKGDCMRTSRIKIESRTASAVYHCISKTNNSERLIESLAAKEVLRKQLWQIAEYCGVQILTYAVMSNHFHVLVRVPLKTDLPDEELLRRFQILYPKPSKYKDTDINAIAAKLKEGGHAADAWRQQQLALMCDVSQFMKLFKQRFAIWFNRTHNRHGYFWSDRFKSVLVEGRGNVLSTMAAYIDLNPVRAGLVSDPKDYRFCGYAEAVQGKKAARDGVIAVVSGSDSQTWGRAQAIYRMRLFGRGAIARKDKAAITPEALEKVMAEKGTLPLATVLRCRVRYFTEGAVLGSEAFVAKHLADYQRRTGYRKRTSLRPFPKVTEEWGDLAAMRGGRKKVFG